MEFETIAALDPWNWPEDAKTILLGIIRDHERDEVERQLATRLAGDMVVVDDEVFDVLLEVVSSSVETPEMRSRAAIAMGAALEAADLEGFDFPEEIPISEATFERATTVLHGLFQDDTLPDLLRRRVLEAAVRAPRDWHEHAIRDAWASGDPEWRLTAAFSMEYVLGFQDEIREALESDDEKVFYHAVIAAGANEMNEAWPAIRAILEDDEADTPLLLAAIEASVLAAPVEAGPYLADLLEDEDEDIAAAAHEAIVTAATLDPDADDFGLLDTFDDLDDDDRPS